MSDDQLFSQICGAYLEMPGLNLTKRQAQRLFGLDESTSGRVIDTLVERGFLRRTASDRYARADADLRRRPLDAAVRPGFRNALAKRAS